MQKRFLLAGVAFSLVAGEVAFAQSGGASQTGSCNLLYTRNKAGRGWGSVADPGALPDPHPGERLTLTAGTSKTFDPDWKHGAKLGFGAHLRWAKNIGTLPIVVRAKWDTMRAGEELRTIAPGAVEKFSHDLIEVKCPAGRCDDPKALGALGSEFEARIGKCNTQPDCCSRDKLIACAYGLLRKEKAADLAYHGIAAGTETERCFTKKLTDRASVALDKNIAYWTEYYKKGYLGRAAQSVTSVATGAIDAICQSYGKPVCDMFHWLTTTAGEFINRVKASSFFDALREKLGNVKDNIVGAMVAKIEWAEAKVKAVFDSFRRVMSMKEFSLAEIKSFAGTVYTTTAEIVAEISKIALPLPPFNIIAETLAGLAVSGAVTAAVTPIAAANFAMRKVMSYVIPKLILGTGTAADVASEHLPKGFQGVAEKLLVAAGAVAGGVIDKVLKDPKTKERVRGVVSKIANLSKGLDQELAKFQKVAAAAGESASIENLAGAVAQQAATQSANAANDEVARTIDALIDFLEEELVRVAEPRLRALLINALGFIDRVLDPPRNMLVGALGTVPFVGGVLAAVINFGLGYLIDFIKETIAGQVTDLARETVSRGVRDDIKKVLRQELLKSPENVKAGESFLALVKTVGEISGEVARAAKVALGGFKAGVRLLALAALERTMLRGVENELLRRILASAIATVADEMTKPGCNVGRVVAALLREAKPGMLALVPEWLRPAMGKAIDDLAQKAEGPGGLKMLAEGGIWKVLGPFFKEAAAAGEAALAQGVFDQFIKELKKNAAAAKKTLDSFMDRFPGKESKEKAQATLSAAGADIVKRADEAAACRDVISGFNKSSGVAVVHCLKATLGTPAPSAAQSATPAQRAPAASPPKAAATPAAPAKKPEVKPAAKPVPPAATAKQTRRR